MIPEKMKEVLKHEGVVALTTVGEDGAHMVNTWNSYIQITDDGRLLIPAGGMNKTEFNVARNNRVLLTLGSREVEGYSGKGTGFLIRGTAEFIKSGAKFEIVRKKFPWARAAVEVKIESLTQTL